MLRRHRLRLAVLIGLFNFVVITAYHWLFPQAINDLYFSLCAGKVILAGGQVYNGSCEQVVMGRVSALYPLTTILATLPFAPFGEAGTLVIWGIMTGVLAFGLLQHGERWRLLVFLSGPFWVAFLCLNWTPLMASLAMLPALTPLWLIKPQNGLPAFLTHLTRRRVAATAAILAFSVIVDPTWPLRWWPKAQTFDFFIPLVLLPFGPLILLGLMFWRDRKMRYALMVSAMPQRFLYDPLLLAWVPDSRPEMLLLTVMGWIGFALIFAFNPPFQQVVVLFCYLPAVAVRWKRLHDQTAALAVLSADSQ